MNKTDVLPDSLDELDFEQPCVIKTQLAMSSEIVPCENPATWAANCPGCGDLTLVCDQHRKGQPGWKWYCPRCTRHSNDLLGWRRL